ncbi:amino acid ABC transporter permease [Clostridia bacterium]|nr:amino acid ABC transporter permease [Clostridia bacterium]
MQIWSNFTSDFYSNFIAEDRYMFLVKGLGITIQVSFFAILLGILLGFTLAFFKLSKSRALQRIASAYISVIRGTPVVTQLLIIYFVFFGSVNISKVIVAIIAFGVNSGAYVAEIVRGGILSVDKGQMEAGRSLGLSYRQTMIHIVIPQALKNIFPALVNEFIVLIKETAIVGYIALEDLTKGADIIRSRTFEPMMPLISAAIIYFILTTILSKAMGVIERRLRKGDQH